MRGKFRHHRSPAWLSVKDWLGGRDSNPDSQIQSLVSYHWTTSQQGKSLYEENRLVVNR
jgi:hypothetical protein